jgi:hypothetical protein
MQIRLVAPALVSYMVQHLIGCSIVKNVWISKLLPRYQINVNVFRCIKENSFRSGENNRSPSNGSICPPSWLVGLLWMHCRSMAIFVLGWANWRTADEVWVASCAERWTNSPLTWFPLLYTLFGLRNSESYGIEESMKSVRNFSKDKIFGLVTMHFTLIPEVRSLYHAQATW